MTNTFATLPWPQARTTVAPDGSDVRVLLSLRGGSMAHFALAPGQVSGAVAHRTVEELWYILSGTGQMWRKQGGREDTTDLQPGMCLTLPLGTHFQFRAGPETRLAIVAVTMPPWPGEDEAYPVPGPWPTSLGDPLK
ncbi:MAG: cupin domain-containing protein [Kiritimatiellia bacterium]|nr:cupin domain-containing protein [Kiritimatiellia bacterium]